MASLIKIFSSEEIFKADIGAEILAQQSLDKEKDYHSLSWQFLRQAQEVFGATTYCGDTALMAPPFFNNVYRGEACTWGEKKEGPLVVNWTGLVKEDRALLQP